MPDSDGGIIAVPFVEKEFSFMPSFDSFDVIDNLASTIVVLLSTLIISPAAASDVNDLPWIALNIAFKRYFNDAMC